MTFDIVRNPGLDILDELYALSGENCFLNPALVKAESPEGATIVAMIVSRSGRKSAFGIARESGRRFARRLVFPVLPYFLESSEDVTTCFWNGLGKYCKDRKILQLDLNGFNSSPIYIPPLSLTTNRTARYEFVLSLTDIGNDGKELASNHRRNIRKGERASLSFQINNNIEACRDHERMISYSMDRREKRGEAIDFEASAETWFSYVHHGLGSVMQATLNDNCMSSVLILESSRNAYYLSGGTSPEGMKVGASHFLIWRVIQHLTDTGVLTLNLGGVTENDSPGLRRFKTGFGAQAIELPHTSFVFGGRWRKRIIDVIRTLRGSS